MRLSCSLSLALVFFSICLAAQPAPLESPSVPLRAATALKQFRSLRDVPPNGCCVRIPEFLRSWWTFDESCCAVAFDIAGASEDNGVHEGGVAHIPGVVGRALCYNGIDAYTTVADSDEIDFKNHCEVDAGTAFTIDFWVYTDQASGTFAILDKREVGANTLKGWSVFVSQGRLGFQMASGSGSGLTCNQPGSPCRNFTSPFTIAGTGRWHFVAVSVTQFCRSSSGTFYVDGQEASFPAGNESLDNSASLEIGRRAPAFGPHFFAGCIDELEIGGLILKEDLDEIYAAGPVGKCKPKIRSRS